MAITQFGLSGPQAAYGAFDAKEEAAVVTMFNGLTTSRLLMYVGLWLLWVWV